MIFRLHTFRKRLLITAMLIVSVLTSSHTLALESGDAQIAPSISWIDDLRTRDLQNFDPKMEGIIRPLRWVKNDKRGFRSKSDVMNEVKRRYKAKVLRISLNESRGVYNVRVLLPSGKVKNVQISARR